MMPYLSCKKIENDVYNFPTWQYCKYKDIFDSHIIINSTAKFYISISYQKDLLSIDTRIFTPSIKECIVRVNYSATELPEHLKKGGIPPFFRVHPWHHYCLLFRAIQLLLLFPVFSVRLRTVLFLLRIRSDIFSGYYMRLPHLHYRLCFHFCTTLSLSGWTVPHIFSLLLATADCTGWYNFLPVL